MFIYYTTISATGAKDALEALTKNKDFARIADNIIIGGAMKGFSSKTFKEKTGKALHSLTCNIVVASDKVYDMVQLFGGLTKDYNLENLQLKFNFRP